MAMIAADDLKSDFNGLGGNGVYNATYLYNFYKDHGGKENFKFNEVDRSDSEYKPYFDRIEILLNWAVYYTACALKYCLKDFDGNDPGCQPGEEEDPERDSENPPRLPPPDLADYLFRFSPIVFSAIVIYIGARRVMR